MISEEDALKGAPGDPPDEIRKISLNILLKFKKKPSEVQIQERNGDQKGVKDFTNISKDYCLVSGPLDVRVPYSYQLIKDKKIESQIREIPSNESESIWIFDAFQNEVVDPTLAFITTSAYFIREENFEIFHQALKQFLSSKLFSRECIKNSTPAYKTIVEKLNSQKDNRIQNILILLGCIPNLTQFNKECVPKKQCCEELIKMIKTIDYPTFMEFSKGSFHNLFLEGLSFVYIYYCYYMSNNIFHYDAYFEEFTRHVKLLKSIAEEKAGIFLEKYLEKWIDIEPDGIYKSNMRKYIIDNYGKIPQISINIAKLSLDFTQLMDSLELYKKNMTEFNSSYEDQIKTANTIVNIIIGYQKRKTKFGFEELENILKLCNDWDQNMTKAICNGLSKISSFKELLTQEYITVNKAINLINLYCNFKYLKYMENPILSIQNIVTRFSNTKINSVVKEIRKTSDIRASLILFGSLNLSKLSIDQSFIEYLIYNISDNLDNLIPSNPDEEIIYKILDGIALAYFTCAVNYGDKKEDVFLDQLRKISTKISNLGYSFEETFLIKLLNFYQKNKLKFTKNLASFLLPKYENVKSIMLLAAELVTTYEEMLKFLDLSEKTFPRRDYDETNIELFAKQTSKIVDKYLMEKRIDSIKYIEDILFVTKDWLEPITKRVLTHNSKYLEKYVFTEKLDIKTRARIIVLYCRYTHINYVSPKDLKDYTYDTYDIFASRSIIKELFVLLNDEVNELQLTETLMNYIEYVFTKKVLTNYNYESIETILTICNPKFDETAIFNLIIKMFYKQGFERFISSINIVNESRYDILKEKYLKQYKYNLLDKNSDELINCFQTLVNIFQNNQNNKLLIQLLNELNLTIDKKDIIKHLIEEPNRSDPYLFLIQEKYEESKLQERIVNEIVKLTNSIKHFNITLELGIKIGNLNHEHQTIFIEFLSYASKQNNSEVTSIENIRIDMRNIIEKLTLQIGKINSLKDQLINILEKFKAHLSNYEELRNVFEEAYKNNSEIIIKDFHFVGLLQNYEELVKLSENNGNICNSNSLVTLFEELKTNNENSGSSQSIPLLIVESIHQLKENIRKIANNPKEMKMEVLYKYFGESIPQEKNEIALHEIEILKSILSTEEEKYMLGKLLLHFILRETYYSNSKIVLKFIKLFNCKQESIKNGCELYIESYENIRTMLIMDYLDNMNDLWDENENEDIYMVMSAVNECSNLKDFTLSLDQEEIATIQEADIYDEKTDNQLLLILGDAWTYFNSIFTSNDYLKIKDSILTLIRNDDYRKINKVFTDCMDHFATLNALRLEMLKKNEANKQIMGYIFTKSKLVIILKDLVTKNIWDVNLTYYPDTNMIKEVNISNLLELRNRANLIANRKTQEDNKGINVELFKNFIDLVDKLTSYLQIRNELELDGYPFFAEKKKEQEFCCINGKFNELKLAEECIHQELRDWSKCIKSNYLNSFSLTHLYGNRFWKFEQELGSKTLSEQSISLLNYMGKDNRLSGVVTHYKIPKRDLNAESRLNHFTQYLNKLDKIPETSSEMRIEELNDQRFTMNQRSIIYCETSNLLEGIITMFCGQNIIPSPNKILFCTKSTSWQQLLSFITRCFISTQFDFFLLVQVDYLSPKNQVSVVSLFEEFYHKKGISFKIGILNTTINSLSKISRAFKIKNYTEVLANHLLFSSNEISKLVKHIQKKEILVVHSTRAGLGKSYWIYQNCGKVLNFLIAGEISIYKLGKQLLEVIQNKNKLICFQIEPVNDQNLLIEIFFQIIILRCLDTPAGFVIFPSDCQIIIEISNSTEEKLGAFKKFAYNFQSRCIENINLGELVCSEEIRFVCAYLKAFQDQSLLQGTVELKKDSFELVNKIKADECKKLLNKYFILPKEAIEENISYSQLDIYIKRMSDTLKGFTRSPIQIQEIINELRSLKDIRMRIFENIHNTNCEFATRSVKNVKFNQELALQLEQINIIGGKINKEYRKNMQQYGNFIQQYQYIEVNFNYINLALFLVTITAVLSQAKLLAQYITQEGLKDYSIMNDFQLLDELINIFNICQDKQEDKENKMNDENKNRIQKMQSMLENYSLIPDNFLKMLLIHERARSQIPIIIMGETGVGKTALIRFFVETVLNERFKMLSLHSGITEEEIIKFISDVQQDLVEPHKTWVFLDEFNTNDSIGRIKEIVCSRTMLGKPLSDSLIFVCACNPYRIKSQVFADQTIGIKRKKKISLTMGNLDSYKLLYTVHPLPETMLNYVWDFGTLSEKTEEKHIHAILKGIKTMSPQIIQLFSNVVSKAQKYFKDRESCSVSLRDVQRYKTICEFFEKYNNLNPSDEHRSGILALIHSYYLKLPNLQQRQEFMKIIAGQLKIDINHIKKIYEDEMAFYLNNMKVPQGLALNEALSENVFAILVCLVNKIPIFICGKPGCSKSLAIKLVKNNLLGKKSTCTLFQKFPEIIRIYVQGSTTCKTETIINAFSKAGKFLVADNTDILPVIVFDEIGLSEISPHNPLKVLHTKLENENINVGFLGISNWKLDASKMNRTLYLARPEPDEKELIITAQSIYESIVSEKGRTQKIKEIMKQLAQTYHKFKLQIEGKPFEDNYGLRDFYYIIKMISRNCNGIIEDEPTIMKIIKKGFERNFGGNTFALNTIQNIFIDIRICGATYNPIPPSSPFDLICDNLSDKDSRYLMIITPGEHGSTILESFMNIHFQQHKTIFGSPFPENTEQYQLETLDNIIQCIENGISISLRNLDNLYPSLYDLFNQSFNNFGGKNRCRIAYGDFYSPNCNVHKDFRCLIQMDEAKMEAQDAPFLNRFEKHLVGIDNILDSNELQIIKKIESWITIVTTPRNFQIKSLLTEKNIFVNYSTENLAIQIYKRRNNKKSMKEIINECKKELILMATPDLLVCAALSQLPEKKIRQLYKTYKETHKHNFGKIIRNSVNSEIKKHIIYTFSKTIPENIIKKEIFKKNITVWKESISNLGNEENLKIDLNEFIKSTEKVYIIEVDIASECHYVTYLKHFFDQYTKELNQAQKIIVIIGLLRRNYLQMNKTSLPYFTNWNQYFLEELSYDSKYLRLTVKLADYDINQILNSTDKTVKRFQNSLGSILDNSFRILKYDQNIFEALTIIDYRRTLCRNILNNRALLVELENKIKADIFANQKADWKREMISNQDIYLTATTSFEAYISSVNYLIQTSLTKIIYELESISSISSLFVNYELEKTQKLNQLIWMDYFKKQKTGANLQLQNNYESAIISLGFELEFPFSKVEFDLIQYLTESYVRDIINKEELFRRFKLTTVIGKHYSKFVNDDLLQEAYFNDMFHFLLTESYLEAEDYCFDFLLAFVDCSEEILAEPFENHLIIFVEYQDLLVKLVNLLKESSIFMKENPRDFLLRISEDYGADTIEEFTSYFLEQLLVQAYPTLELITKKDNIKQICFLIERQNHIIQQIIIESSIEIDIDMLNRLQFWIHFIKLLDLTPINESKKLQFLKKISTNYKQFMTNEAQSELYSLKNSFLSKIDKVHEDILKLISTSDIKAKAIKEKIMKFNAYKLFSLLTKQISDLQLTEIIIKEFFSFINYFIDHINAYKFIYLLIDIYLLNVE